MTVDAARKWLIASSLSITALAFGFFLLAPALGFPLTFSQSLRILGVILPVFLGYLASAATFAFRNSSSADEVVIRKGASSLLGILIVGPIVVFFIALSTVTIAFGITNRSEAPPGSGITIDQLAAAMSVILGLLTVTTSVAVGYFFSGGESVANTDINRVGTVSGRTDEV